MTSREQHTTEAFRLLRKADDLFRKYPSVSVAASTLALAHFAAVEWSPPAESDPWDAQP